jgi:hypothetical protein
MTPRVPEPLPEYLKFLSPYGPRVIELALATRTLVLEEAHGAHELIYDAYNAVASGYSFTGRPSDACLHIAVYARWVNLGFNFGSQLPDPEGLLRGSGQWTRHIRIAETEDLRNPAVRSLVRSAVARAERPVRAAAAGQSVVRAVYPKRRRPAER